MQVDGVSHVSVTLSHSPLSHSLLAAHAPPSGWRAVHCIVVASQ
jgi:hypothetical protein